MHLLRSVVKKGHLVLIKLRLVLLTTGISVTAMLFKRVPTLASARSG